MRVNQVGGKPSILTVHVRRSDGQDGWHDEDDGNEERPDASPGTDEWADDWTKVPWARLELSKDQTAEDWNTITPVQGDGSDVEDTGDGSVGSETDEVDGNAPEDGDPDSKDWGAGQWEDLNPDVGEWQEVVTAEGEDSASERLHGSEGDELDDDEGADGECDTARLSENVVEDLRDWLSDLRGQDVLWRAHDEAKDDVEEETGNVGEQHGHRNGPWCLDLWLDDFLGDMSGSIVVSHGPGNRQEAEEE